jgi:hypothetical protein
MDLVRAPSLTITTVLVPGPYIPSFGTRETLDPCIVKQVFVDEEEEEVGS